MSDVEWVDQEGLPMIKIPPNKEPKPTLVDDSTQGERRMREPVLYQETKCDHGSVDSHYTCNGEDQPERGNFQHTDENCGCDGGTRKEFTPDRKAAVQVFRDAGYNNKGLQILLDQAIDASLGIVEPF